MKPLAEACEVREKQLKADNKGQIFDFPQFKFKKLLMGALLRFYVRAYLNHICK